jgi:ABC-type multidrug transport system fused ATPase/permease subunit
VGHHDDSPWHGDGCGCSNGTRPGHFLLFGFVINQFVYYDLATNPAAQANSTANETGYFCSESSSGDEITANLLLFVSDPDATLLREIGLYCLYYVGIGGGAFITVYLATVLWNISAYRQTRRMRMAFYRSILRQEIGWFDVSDANELSTRLTE